MKLKIKDLTFSYPGHTILDGITVEIEPSEFFGIIGPNGTGKTTLIKCIDTILKPHGGCVMLDGMEVRDLDKRELAKRIGYVPQHAPGGFPATVFDTILMGRRPYIGWRVTEKDLERVLETVELLGIEELSLRPFGELSGGERQKVLVARALCQDPEVLLLDEPTSNLDIKHQLEVMKIIQTITRKRGILAIMAIHDLNLASRYADRVAMMHGGKIAAVGTPEDVLTVENIRSVYGVEVAVRNDGGKPYILPIRPVEV
ncbi:MAG: ABC transporter ATP-binding protein [Candidatus Syntrophoarchaeum sp.]|nr:ABC transporter ATP-binding protein [Candidatus Syntrophoarchaeum sp.]